MSDHLEAGPDCRLVLMTEEAFMALVERHLAHMRQLNEVQAPMELGVDFGEPTTAKVTFYGPTITLRYGDVAND